MSRRNVGLKFGSKQRYLLLADAVERAEWFWTNLPTGRKWTGLATHEKALVCHQIARITPSLAAQDGLVEALEHILEYWNRDQNEDAMSDALWHIIETASNALSAIKEQHHD